MKMEMEMEILKMRWESSRRVPINFEYKGISNVILLAQQCKMNLNEFYIHVVEPAAVLSMTNVYSLTEPNRRIKVFYLQWPGNSQATADYHGSTSLAFPSNNLRCFKLW